jgi:hypothetical protein
MASRRACLCCRPFRRLHGILGLLGCRQTLDGPHNHPRRRKRHRCRVTVLCRCTRQPNQKRKRRNDGESRTRLQARMGPLSRSSGVEIACRDRWCRWYITTDFERYARLCRKGRDFVGGTRRSECWRKARNQHPSIPGLYTTTGQERPTVSFPSSTRTGEVRVSRFAHAYGNVVLPNSDTARRFHLDAPLKSLLYQLSRPYCHHRHPYSRPYAR